MRNSNLLLAAFAVVLCVPNVPAGIEIRQYILGDIDNFVYAGPGSVDDVYVEPNWLNVLMRYPLSINSFDVLETNQLVPFSFVYNLSSDEHVVAATLSLGLRGNGYNVFYTSEILSNGSVVVGIKPSFEELGWILSETETIICSVNLADVRDYNFIPFLQSGEFSAAVGLNYVGIDYVILTLEVIPEPSTVALLVIGILALKRSRR